MTACNLNSVLAILFFLSLGSSIVFYYFSQPSIYQTYPEYYTALVRVNKDQNLNNNDTHSSNVDAKGSKQSMMRNRKQPKDVVKENNNNLDQDVADLRLVELTLPPLEKGDILVKVLASTCNPSDILYMKGQYGVHPSRTPHYYTSKDVKVSEDGLGDSITTTIGTTTATEELVHSGVVKVTKLGFEGAGLVIASGGGIIGRMNLGKMVSFRSTQGGAWAQYIVVKRNEIIPLDGDISLERGAAGFVNPFSIIGMIDVARKRGVRSIIHTAAASQLGQQLVVFARLQGIEVINIVRSEEQRNILMQEFNATYVLNSEEEQFEEKLSILATSLNAKLAFDAIGAEMTGRLIKAMPPHSTVMVYGVLGVEPISGISMSDLIFQSKSVEAFWLTTWLQGNSISSMLLGFKYIQQILREIPVLPYAANYSLATAAEGIQQYQKKRTKGKILILPWSSSKGFQLTPE